MPIYEFYCSDCHCIFNFFSRTVNTEKRPDCPRCGRPRIERQVSLFAISKGRTEAEDEGMPDLDEAKLERAMEALAGEAEVLDEENPRQVGNLMRKLYAATGMKLGPGMEEAIRRMEAGGDPDEIEAQLGEVLEGEDPFSPEGAKAFRRKYLPPSKDETLYEL
ncbi:MAG: zinc ribbon domain-containing protein [Deltaproteobacteria bacterium]|nr:zinc ribbon domain-containing protein [Deltaproteobacteria bacterium]